MTGVAFLPILALDGQEGRLFAPLAWAKTIAILDGGDTRRDARSGIAAVACGMVSLDSAARIHSSSELALIRAYTPVVEFALRHKRLTLGGGRRGGRRDDSRAGSRIGTELMPPLDEGVILYMPSTMPGISMAEATRLLQSTDRILKSFPEVESVLGKAGRASTATDPAPLSMLETLVVLKPREQWPSRPGLGRMTTEQLVAAMDQALKLPGVIQLMDDAHPRPHGHAGHRNAQPARPQDHRPDDGRHSKARRESRGRFESGFRDPIRFRRTNRRWLLSRHRLGSRRTGTAGYQHRSGPNGGPECDRR